MADTATKTRIISFQFARPITGGKVHIVRRDGNSLCGRQLTFGRMTRCKPQGRDACSRCAAKGHLILAEEGSSVLSSVLEDFTIPVWVITLPDDYICTKTTNHSDALRKFDTLKEKWGKGTKLEERRATLSKEGGICLV